MANAVAEQSVVRRAERVRDLLDREGVRYDYGRLARPLVGQFCLHRPSHPGF